MTEKTLLEQAMEAADRGGKNLKIGNEELDLLIGYLTGKVSTSQVATVMGCSAANVYIRLSNWMRKACMAGLIKITRVS